MKTTTGTERWTIQKLSHPRSSQRKGSFHGWNKPLEERLEGLLNTEEVHKTHRSSIPTHSLPGEVSTLSGVSTLTVLLVHSWTPIDHWEGVQIRVVSLCPRSRPYHGSKRCVNDSVDMGFSVSSGPSTPGVQPPVLGRVKGCRIGTTLQTVSKWSRPSSCGTSRNFSRELLQQGSGRLYRHEKIVSPWLPSSPFFGLFYYS